MLLNWALYGGAGLLLIAVVTGKMHVLGAVLAAVLAFAKLGFSTFMRFMPFFQTLRRNDLLGTPSFSTPYLKVEINLQTGVISGEIIKGPHEGKSLTSLSDADFEELEAFYEAENKKSYYLIRAIRQRLSGHRYQQQRQ